MFKRLVLFHFGNRVQLEKVKLGEKLARLVRLKSGSHVELDKFDKFALLASLGDCWRAAGGSSLESHEIRFAAERKVGTCKNVLEVLRNLEGLG